MGNSNSSSEPQIEDAGKDCATCGEEACNYNPNLVGTVNYYTKHFVICSGLQDWPKKVEKVPGTFACKFLSHVKANADKIKGEVKVTLCDEASRGEGLDIYVFPEQIKYIGVKDEDIEVLVSEQLIQDKIPTTLNHISTKELHFVLVCIHATRDKRCGRIGPKVLDKFKEAITSRDLSHQIKILGTNHIGGHKYAGVIIVYPSGTWYGYVSERNVDKIVDDYLANHGIIPEFWRGQIGLTKEEQIKQARLGGK